ncbi:MAG: helix-turn-helix domain-containing protein [Planctomycetota bacterium]
MAQQIADALQEKIDALPRFYGSHYTKADCCKFLIGPLLGENPIDTLLESMPVRAAKTLGNKHSNLMSCFDQTGELLNQDLLLATIKRYVKDLIKELRSLGQKNKRSSKKKTKKPKSIKERFTFRPGQVLFDNRDVNIGTGAALEIIETLVKNFGHVVPYGKFDANSSQKEASEKIRTAINRIRKKTKSKKIPVIIDNRKSEGYVMLPSAR